MKITIDNHDIIGTPEEMQYLLKLLKPTPIRVNAEASKIVRESQALRKKLAQDPDYAPYGGVVKSKEETSQYMAEEREYAADLDTGVDYGQ